MEIKNLIRSKIAKLQHLTNPNFAMKGKHHSQEVKEKIRLSNLGKKHKPHSEETKKKIALASRNRIWKEESRKKSSETRLRLIKEGKIIFTGFHGKHSKESKEKISINNWTHQLDYVHPMQGKMHKLDSIQKMKESRNQGLKDGHIKIWNKGKPATEKEKERLKELRRNMILPRYDTKIEVKIQNFLDQLKIEYFAHKYININHAYQCDIFIPSLNMVIECDGDYWHKYPTGTEIDHIRTKELIEKGFKVLRLWETEIKQMNLEKFKEKIWN